MQVFHRFHQFLCTAMRKPSAPIDPPQRLTEAYDINPRVSVKTKRRRFTGNRKSYTEFDPTVDCILKKENKSRKHCNDVIQKIEPTNCICIKSLVTESQK